MNDRRCVDPGCLFQELERRSAISYHVALTRNPKHGKIAKTYVIFMKKKSYFTENL